MILVDTALRQRESEGRPVRVGVFGAGAMAKGFVAQVTALVPGMDVVAISNRTLQRAADAYAYAGRGEAEAVDSLAALDQGIAAGRPVITDDPDLLTRSAGIDCLIDMTGAVDHGATLALAAIQQGKPLVLMNAELDATIGPILHERARNAGVLLSCCDGDQPGVQLNLWRYVQGLGLVPRVLGNIKGLQDESRTPATQQGFAEQWNQNVTMVTSFADGSKVNVEQAIVANATGFTVTQRGMSRREHRGHVDELTAVYDLEQLRELGGVVDFVIGARPSPGVFCLAEMPDARHVPYLELYKLGTGPLYSFYQPYHLCYLEAPMSVARAVLFGDVVGRPLGAPVVEVVAIAKRNLQAGETLDAFGGHLTYGQAERATVVHGEDLLPAGLAEGCRLLRPIARGEAIRWSDVQAPGEQLAHRLYAEQRARWGDDGAAPPGA
jgi:predicted homoserine dehydrogenase-like protein